MRIGTLLLTIIVIAVGALAYRAMQSASSQAVVNEPTEPVLTVATASAQITTYRPVISVIGTIEAKDVATITSPLATEVVNVLVEEGDIVVAGDELVKLDLRETNLQLEAQLASLDEIQAQLESLAQKSILERRRLREIQQLAVLAKDELERNETLQKSGLAAQALVDQSRSAVSARNIELISQQQRLDDINLSQRSFEARTRQIRAQIGQLRLVIERAQIKAPFDGVIKLVNTSTGTRINQGMVLIEIYDPSTIRLRAAIPNDYAVSTDLQGTMMRNNKTEDITLLSIAPEAKVGRGTVDAFFRLPLGDWLLGTAVEFNLLLPPETNSVALPFDALYAGNRVYTVDAENRALAVECQNIGQTYTAETLNILLRCPTLKNNEQIVINRVPNLVNGTKLNVVNS